MNRLAGSTSPYLLQHKDNPVDWQVWGDEAFAEAAQRNVPVLLSVGYSACHWCHVMAHESFEDPATAAEMNRLFVNVKVDREERPDVDAIYMEAVQTMTGRGGWPMTVWLTPDGRPFYAGTYFPDTDRHGMPSFRRIMEAVSSIWVERQQEVEDQAQKLTEAIARALPPVPVSPDLDTLKAAYRSLEAGFDFRLGGFGPAPKFPQQPVLEFLLRIHRQPWAERAGEMVRLTLGAMASGGIHDQLGGGFARYSVDDHWLVPHFEKMLYDNAQLARLYLWAGIELGDPSLVAVARSTIDYMLRDLHDPGGGFYSAEDADSEGVEGRFYVWALEEAMAVAGADDGPATAFALGITEAGNFEGFNILTRRPEAAILDRYGAEGLEAVRRASARLLEARTKRVRPGLDDKVVAAWNGLMLRALAEAGAALDEPSYLDAARDCARFLIAEMLDDGRMARSWRRGSRSGPGFLDDHAAVAIGLFALYAATGEVGWFREARRLVGELMGRFADGEGGFFSTSSDADVLIKRPRDQFDNPSPSGSALAAEALLITSLYTGEGELRHAAERAIEASGVLLTRYPSGAAHHLSVLTALELGTFELAVSGPDASELASVMWEEWRPAGVLGIDIDGSQQESVPLLAGRFQPGRTLAYVCRDFACEAPVADEGSLRKLLDAV